MKINHHNIHLVGKKKSVFIFLQFEIFFRENFFTFRGISSMYVCIFVESIFLMSRLQSLRPILFFFQPPKVRLASAGV